MIMKFTNSYSISLKIYRGHLINRIYLIYLFQILWVEKKWALYWGKDKFYKEKKKM